MEAIITAEAQAKIDESQELARSYEHYAIDCAEKYQSSADVLKTIKAKAKELDETRKSMTAPLDATKKKIMELFKKPLDFLSQAESEVKGAMLDWQREQERIRREEEERLAAIQRAEAEKLHKAAEKEAARIAALKTEAAKERAAAKAEELQAKAEAVVAIAPVVESKVEEVQGISTRKIWKFRITDVEQIPRKYMVPDESYIGKVVRATQGKEKIAGIEIYSEDIMSARI